MSGGARQAGSELPGGHLTRPASLPDSLVTSVRPSAAAPSWAPTCSFKLHSERRKARGQIPPPMAAVKKSGNQGSARDAYCPGVKL
ncbi:hypothetical protein NDU88_004775 [Pleurodeles waltl]|uniref:Uncharacterized protein n=1 Tax=Pleurodeles waltl TaxID=8319 RepID=A0AAV7LKX2_PLEWA|nr:hypothetical protein NDU88_004775 [Pleurodeles waltl]